MNCNICNNQLSTRPKIISWPRGHFGNPKTQGKETYCWYCEWKGISGAGKLLREIIKRGAV